ncbi:hypothetical protein IAR55_005286 [Kwoniella newhampshirensis]|uniref:CCD97-like C-terminal domain-containing protein n=1 Tax=Kwoniella newhampshirensis TaxID=1651941 RepID=A0AAW0YYZ7_9TREE
MLLARSSPQMMGRPSSPLNPNAPPPPSSSPPMTSPTPSYSYPYISPMTQRTANRSGVGGPSNERTPIRQTRYSRPSSASSSSKRPSHRQLLSDHPQDLFTTGGTTPMEGLLWKERFSRRMKERERRKERRQADLDRRRGVGSGSSDPIEAEDEEEADRKAQEDDEEIFRRLVIVQRRKAHHATLVSHEVETGGSDPNLPEFWADELDSLAREERDLLRRLTDDERDHCQSLPQFMSSSSHVRSTEEHGETIYGLHEGVENEEDVWAMEAAQAEEVEREVEEAEVARSVEQAYGMNDQGRLRIQAQIESADMDMDMDMDMGMDMGMDWDSFDSMDVE